MKTEYLILGGGPAGLTFAQCLKRKGITDFVLVEKENEVGGLCRSEIVDGSPLDIGGGHFLDVRRPRICEFLFEFMPENEWNRYSRDSRISFSIIPEESKSGKAKTYEIHHPFEANIWELPKSQQKRYLDSIAEAGCNTGEPKPTRFVEWIRWKLGDAICGDYMIPYNTKLYANNLNELGTYWLEKLPNVSYEETLESCKQKKAYGSQPGHTEFYYPKKYGYGEVWRRMGEDLGDKVIKGMAVKSVDCMNCIVELEDGTLIEAKQIISTIPWNSIELKWAPTKIKDSIKKLKSSSVNITYKPEMLNTEAQWIYYPDMELDYHRILVRSNFCPGSKGYWTETRSERYHEAEGDITFRMDYAYPLNTIAKPDAMDRILDFASKSHITGLGRWGEHNHYNSDVTVDRAIKLAEKLTK
ncbi:MAG: FAD-dependent oxidoreductase [Lachnospiraceae bacterium]|nr:FAD-dependent oxidoreductase [Candidatus Colinaster scatohippi]